MMTDEFEIDLRAALARCAADVPAHVGERLRRHNYHPRGPRHLLKGLAAAVVVLGTGAAVLSTGTISPGTRQSTHDASSSTTPTSSTRLTIPLTGSTIRLADATVRLPAGFTQVDSACAPTPSGIEGGIPFTGNPFAAAASSAGGCIDFLVASSASRPPAGSESVTVGGYPGSLATDQSTRVTTLYVTIPADLDLVLTAEGLSANEVESIAAAIIPNLARQLVALAEASTNG